MGPHADQRGDQSDTGGRKRKNIDGGQRVPPSQPSKNKRAGADPGREKVVPAGRNVANSGNSAVLGKGKKSVGGGAADGRGGKEKAKGKGKAEIDDIFADVKRLKQAKVDEEVERVAAKKKAREEHKRRQANPFTGEGGPEKRWAWADEVKPVRFDEDGLPIYTWDSLRIGQGGGTDLCPFDCDCCF